MHPDSHNPITAHGALSREFLAKSRKYLAIGDLHQASEKGWGAAAHIAKAVALAQGWQYTRHSHFHRLMNQAGQATGNNRLRYLHGRAEILHINFYDLKDELALDEISRDIEDIAELLEILYPLTGLESSG